MIRKVVGEKRCSNCKDVRSFDDFQRRNSKNNFSLYSWCKECHAKHQKWAREPNKKKSNERIQELRAIRREEIRETIIKHLRQNPCAKCNEKDILVLEFDHRDPKTKEFCISQAIGLVPSLERLEKEIAKCDILCANCHKRKTAFENNNFKLKYMVP
jgi:hypothetical protein